MGGSVLVVVVAAILWAGGVADSVSIATGAPSASPSAASTSSAVTPPPSSTPSTAPSTDAELALAALQGLVVSNVNSADYDRDRFGQTWFDVDGNGCDTRNDILGRDLVQTVLKPDTGGCKVLEGILIDPYDDQQVGFVAGTNTSQFVQIDHVVALALAWRGGADLWSDEQRLAFANDPANLVASSAEMNQEKSDSGPSEWLPPVAERRCDFVKRFVDVLAAYRLRITDADRASSEAVLRGCPAT